MAKSGQHGLGSVFYVPTRELWKAVIDLPPEHGKRRQWSATSREQAGAQAKLDSKRAELIAAGHLEDREARPRLTRYQWRLEAKKVGTHSRADIRGLYRAMPDACPKCMVRITQFNFVIDHITPITRGGSDAIENMQIICWECNIAKGDMMNWIYTGPVPRPYRPMGVKVLTYAPKA